MEKGTTHKLDRNKIKYHKATIEYQNRIKEDLNKYFLIIIDSYSRGIKIGEAKSTEAEGTIKNWEIDLLCYKYQEK